MKKQRLFITFVAMIVVLVSVSMADAFDTSPYLAGTWEDTTVISTNSYQLINPTTKTLDVWAFMYLSDNSFVDCAKFTIAANASLRVYAFSPRAPVPYGAMKFFAFPQGSKKFDPNAVIGGFQRKAIGASNGDVFNTEANLKAVTINSYTIGEFQSADCVF